MLAQVLPLGGGRSPLSEFPATPVQPRCGHLGPATLKVGKISTKAPFPCQPFPGCGSAQVALALLFPPLSPQLHTELKQSSKRARTEPGTAGLSFPLHVAGTPMSTPWPPCSSCTCGSSRSPSCLGCSTRISCSVGRLWKLMRQR